MFRASLETLCFVLEQDSFFNCLLLVKQRKCLDMTEKVLTGTESTKAMEHIGLPKAHG